MDEIMGMGWIPDHPDLRDYTPEHEKIKALFERAKEKGSKKIKAAAAVNLRPWCSPIENQLNLGSCTANAGVGMYEYFERRAIGNRRDQASTFERHGKSGHEEDLVFDPLYPLHPCG